MTTPDSIARAGIALDGAVARLQAGSRAADPHALMAAGRLHVRLEAIRALSVRQAAAAGLLAEELIETIARDLRDDDPRAAIHAAAGAALLGAA